jgi:hypothetical protein
LTYLGHIPIVFFPMTAAPRHLCCAAGAAFFVALAVRGFAQAPLPKDSPFMPAAGGAGTVTNPNEIWELAAVQTIDLKTSVYIYDRQAKKGKWVPVGSTVEGITAKSYDAARELAAVQIGGVEKLLNLRKASATPNTGVAAVTAAPNSWSIPPLAANAPTSPTAVAAATPATTLAIPQPPPPAPGTVAHQEQEARMLVSDLLEIGIAQRKAYEEAQKKAAAEKAGQAATAPKP